MTIKVNLTDIYPEADGCSGDGYCTFASISEAIQQEVTGAIQGKIMESIDEDLKKSILSAVKEKVLLHLDIKIKRKVRQLMREGMIQPSHYTSPIKITDHIEKLFKSNGEWLKEGEVFLKRHTEEIARKFSEDLKNKYDMIFAAQIVDSLGKAGLLKDDAVKKLVSNG
jgi:hypothetical protein